MKRKNVAIQRLRIIKNGVLNFCKFMKVTTAIPDSAK